MKKILLGMAGLLFSVSLYAAGGYFNAGAGINLSAYAWSSSSQASISESIFSLDAYADFNYARIELGYGFNVGVPAGNAGNPSEIVGGTAIAETNESDLFLTIAFLGKYPFALGRGISIWPAIGLEKDIILNEAVDGTNVTSSQAGLDIMSPLLLKFGGGADITIGNFVLVPYAYYGINLTSKPGTDTAVLLTYSSSKIDIGVSFGIKF
jgi:hypothetical protein